MFSCGGKKISSFRVFISKLVVVDYSGGGFARICRTVFENKIEI